MAIQSLPKWIATLIPSPNGNVKVWDGGTGDGIPKEFSTSTEALDDIKIKGFPTNDVKIYQQYSVTETLEVTNNNLAGQQG